MKAKIVRQRIYDGDLDFIHGGGYEVKKLVVEELGNLVIMLHGGQIIVFNGFKIDNSCEILGETEISEKLIAKALAFFKAKIELESLASEFKALLE